MVLLVGLTAAACVPPPGAGAAVSKDGAAPVAADEDAARAATGASPVDAGMSSTADAARPGTDAAQWDASDGTFGSGSDAGQGEPDASGAGGPRAPAPDAATDAATLGAPSGFILGADITWAQADESFGATFSDGRERDILEILRDHGFNYVRLRTFVDPRAADGYDRENGFGDLAHTIAFGKRIKARGLGFLLDLHYSDNWADPGKP